MDLSTQSIAELSALATVIGVVLFTVWRGIPALIAYLERKDAKHREDVMTLLTTSREEREQFCQNLNNLTNELKCIHNRLDVIDSKIITTLKQP